MRKFIRRTFAVLKAWDNGAHTDAEYEMAMLYGLNFSDPNATATETADLQTEYNSLLTQYGITSDQINQFNLNNLKATTNKLPTSGCN